MVSPTPVALSFNAPQPYPHFDRLHHDPARILPAEIAALILAAPGPVIELGGPTQSGYRQLQDQVVLPGRVYMTNFMEWRDGEEAIIDGGDTPFPNDSVGIYLAAHMGVTDYFGLKLRYPGRPQHAFDEQAANEYARITEPGFTPEYNLRLRVLAEMVRTLELGGLAIFECLSQHDIEAATHLGFTVLNQQPIKAGQESYDCVLQKPLRK